MPDITELLRIAKARAAALMRPAQPDVEQDAARARAGAEDINAALPDALSARQAILRKRQQLRDLDEQTRE